MIICFVANKILFGWKIRCSVHEISTSEYQVLFSTGGQILEVSNFDPLRPNKLFSTQKSFFGILRFLVIPKIYNMTIFAPLFDDLWPSKDTTTILIQNQQNLIRFFWSKIHPVSLKIPKKLVSEGNDVKRRFPVEFVTSDLPHPRYGHFGSFSAFLHHRPQGIKNVSWPKTISFIEKFRLLAF